MRFPVQAMDELAPTIEYLSQSYDVPTSMVAISMLGALATITCLNRKVQGITGEIIHPSMYGLTLAKTGKAKSPIFDVITKPFFDFECEKEKEFQKEINRRAQFPKKELILLPTIVNPEFVYNTGTIEAVLESLSNGFPLGLWLNDEGISISENWSFLKQNRPATCGFLNKQWSSSMAKHKVRTGISFKLRNRPLNILWAFQYEKGIELITDDNVIQSGFSARFLIDINVTEMSSTPPNFIETQSDDRVIVFQKKLTDFLHQQTGIYLGYGKGAGIGKSPFFTPNDRENGLYDLPYLVIKKGDFEIVKKFTDIYWSKAKENEKIQNIMGQSYFLKAHNHLLRIASWLHFWNYKDCLSINTDCLINAHDIVLFFGNTHEKLHNIDASVESKLANKIIKKLKEPKYETGLYMSQLKKLIRGIRKLNQHEMGNLLDILQERGAKTKAKFEGAKSAFYIEKKEK